MLEKEDIIEYIVDKAKSALFDAEHKIGIFVFLLLAIVGIPLTIVGVKSSQDNRSRAAGPESALQIGYFNPSNYGIKAGIAHTDNEILVRFTSAVDIKTSPNINQDTSSFKTSDIQSGLSQSSISKIESASVSSIEKAFKNVATTNTSAKTYISNVYKMTLASGVDIANAMQTICSDPKITMYCEPNYTFTPAMNLSNGGSRVLAATTNDGGLSAPNPQKPSVLMAMVDTPLPSNYADVVNTLKIKPITQSQILPTIESPRTDAYKYHVLFAATAAYLVNPGTQLVFSGACGSNCSNADLAKGVIDATNKGAKVIYIGEVALFPQGIEPQSLISAIDYAVNRGATVVAPQPNKTKVTGMIPSNQPKTVSWFDNLSSLFGITNHFPPIVMAQGLPSKVQNAMTQNVPNPSFQLQTDLDNYAQGKTGSGISQANNTGTIYISPNDTSIIKEMVTAVNKNATDADVQNVIKASSANTDANGRIDAATIFQQAAQLSGATSPSTSNPTSNTGTNTTGASGNKTNTPANPSTNGSAAAGNSTGTVAQPVSNAAVTKPNLSSTPASLNSYVNSPTNKDLKSTMNSLLPGYSNAPGGVTATNGTSISTGNAGAMLAMMYAVPGADKISPTDMNTILNDTNAKNIGYNVADTLQAVANKANEVAAVPPPAAPNPVPPNDPPPVQSAPAVAAAPQTGPVKSNPIPLPLAVPRSNVFNAVFNPNDPTGTGCNNTDGNGCDNSTTGNVVDSTTTAVQQAFVPLPVTPNGIQLASRVTPNPSTGQSTVSYAPGTITPPSVGDAGCLDGTNCNTGSGSNQAPVIPNGDISTVVGGVTDQQKLDELNSERAGYNLPPLDTLPTSSDVSTSGQTDLSSIGNDNNLGGQDNTQPIPGLPADQQTTTADQQAAADQASQNQTTIDQMSQQVPDLPASVDQTISSVADTITPQDPIVADPPPVQFDPPPPFSW